ncbi:PTS mannose/fructose/sorbose/N-acetylgalactosamine transporter subunit IIC [Catenisphaera adipataccumulans]|uniref:PTS system mannose-specific IIC component n=1 Tax=Catenisphaera adipataccumulans TaxID=700500 RepID=A0A7W8FV54_9FIRM|nr:PTS sugar transporter subunit IIC [Catenisphaera adipataccumulans]MBB5182783.1 PTS system mannose-specific IIC component [Catenisphaera adipataccumulans]
MSISVLQAVLLGILYWIGEANLPFVGLWTIQRPLVCGWIAGIILGDPLTGAMVGASINLVYLGFISAGGSMPADMALAGTLGATYAITGNLDAKTALALAVPIGILGTLVWYTRMTLDSVFVHLGDRFVDKEQYNKLWIANVLLPQIMSAAICIIPCSLAAYFGAAYIEDFVDMLSGTPLTIFQIIGGMMPALGIAITLQYIFKGESRAFLFLGFVIAVYSGLGLLPLGVIALLMAIVYTQLAYKQHEDKSKAAEEADMEEDF